MSFINTTFLDGMPKQWALQIILAEGLAIQRLMEDGKGRTPEEILSGDLTEAQHFSKAILAVGYLLNRQGLFSLEQRAMLAEEVEPELAHAVSKVLGGVYSSMDKIYSELEQESDLLGSTGSGKTLQ